jgi:hypothetical protein
MLVDRLDGVCRLERGGYSEAIVRTIITPLVGIQTEEGMPAFLRGPNCSTF